MPSPYIVSLAKKTGKTEKEIEKLWDKAKEIASETLGVKIANFGSKEYKYTTGIVKNMLGVKEELLDPTQFLHSDKSAKEFIETIVSASYNIGNVIPPKEEEPIPEEDEEDIIDELDAVLNEPTELDPEEIPVVEEVPTESEEDEYSDADDEDSIGKQLDAILDMDL